jgi:hypothetical protein
MYVCVVVHRRTGLKNQIHVRDIETSCCNVSGYKYINLALKKGSSGNSRKEVGWQEVVGIGMSGVGIGQSTIRGA